MINNFRKPQRNGDSSRLKIKGYSGFTGPGYSLAEPQVPLWWHKARPQLHSLEAISDSSATLAT